MSIHQTEDDYWESKKKSKTKTILIIILLLLLPILGVLL